MQKHSDALLTSAGNAVSGASVVVTKQDDSAATLYSDNGVTPISSTLASDPSGEYSFYAPNGRYKKVVSGTGLTTETVSDILVYDPNDGDVAHAEFYATLQAALDTGRKVRLTRGTTYTVSTTLSVPSGGGLIAEWDATLQAANNLNSNVISIAADANDVEIRGIVINGNKANNASGNGIAIPSGGYNIRVRNNYIYNCKEHGVYSAGTTVYGIHVTGNFVTGCGSGGITAYDTTLKFRFDSNFAWLNGTHGVGILGVAKHGSISNNEAWDNGQGTPNADNITGYNVSNDNLLVSGNVTYGGLNNGIHMGGSRLVVSNNTVYGAAQYGIAVWPNTGAGDDVVVTGNVAYLNGVSGIWIQNCNSGTVSGNVSRGNTAHGFAIDACTYVAFTGNTSRGNTLDGFRNGTASSYLTFSGNTSRANGGDGIELANVTLSTLTGNVFANNTGYGINVSGTEANNIIGHNQVCANTAGQIAQPAATSRVVANETATTRTLASAATLTLPPGGEYFYITGTTDITSITVSFPERRVTLQFDDVLTVTDGSNLRLAGNFSTTFMDTITLICDGTNWVECSRSVN